jgi:hypothetical protein
MVSEMRLGDIVSTGTNTDVGQNLKQMECGFLSVCDWIKNNRPRNEQNVTLFNLLASSAQYLGLASENLESHASVLALATRSLYEVNLRTRSVLISEENMRQWHSEAVTDKIQVLEGLLELDTVNDMNTQRATLRAEVERLTALREKYKLPSVKKPLDAGVIANDLGLSGEHKALFKLITKLVHPSSYLINDYSNAASSEVRAILQVHAQMYAWDTFSRICDVASVPKAFREFHILESAGHA